MHNNEKTNEETANKLKQNKHGTRERMPNKRFYKRVSSKVFSSSFLQMISDLPDTKHLIR